MVWSSRVTSYSPFGAYARRWPPCLAIPSTEGIDQQVVSREKLCEFRVNMSVVRLVEATLPHMASQWNNCTFCGAKFLGTHRTKYCPEHSGYKRRAASERKQKIEQLGREPMRCDICGVVFSSENDQNRSNWDHNHETGDGRGWLCIPCNAGLGYFGDNPRLLRSAENYLREKGFAARRTVIK